MSNWEDNFPFDGLYIKDIPKVIRDKTKELKDGRIVDAGKLQGHGAEYFAVADHAHKEFIDEFIAGENIQPFQLLYIKAANIVAKTSFLNIEQGDKIVGFAIQQGIPGDTIKVRVSGYITNDSWDLISGNIYYAGNNGLITPNKPFQGFAQKIGVAKNQKTLLMQISGQQTIEGSYIDIDGGFFTT